MVKNQLSMTFILVRYVFYDRGVPHYMQISQATQNPPLHNSSYWYIIYIPLDQKKSSELATDGDQITAWNHIAATIIITIILSNACTAPAVERDCHLSQQFDDALAASLVCTIVFVLSPRRQP